MKGGFSYGRYRSLVTRGNLAPYADMAQSVERHLGKVEVAGSIPAISSNFFYWDIYLDGED